MADARDVRTVEELAELLQQLVNRRSYAETDVLTIDELCAALKVGRTKLFDIYPKLPISFGLGDRLPRVIWGDMLQYLRDTRRD